MKFSRTYLFSRSRDTRFLLRAALAIGAISVGVALLISLFSVKAGSSPLHPFTTDLFSDSVDSISQDWNVEQWAHEIRAEAGNGDNENPHESLDEPDGPKTPGIGLPLGKDESEELDGSLEDILDRLSKSSLPDSELSLLRDLAKGLMGDETVSAVAVSHLQETSGGVSAPRFAAEFLGDVRSRMHDWNGAIEAFQQEVDRFPDEADRALHRLMQLLRQESRTEELKELQSRDDLKGHFSLHDQFRQAISERDYLKLLVLSIQGDLQFHDPWLVLLSLFAAAIWFTIITQFSGAWRKKGGLYLIAIVLGYFSATATIYVHTLQENFLNFTHNPNDSILDQLIYCIAGIGLREEFLKLLLFVPLVPFLAKRDHEIDALICAGLVGLGFAFNENTGYIFRGGGEFGTWGRFLTANFFHIALTGVAGLSLVRCWRWPERQWDNFLYDFLIVVAAHGAYDALLMIPALMEYGIIYIIIFALIAYLFLDQATHLMRPQSSMTISPLAVFVLGSALLMGVVLCYACWAVPFAQALGAYLSGLGGMIAIIFVFINRLRSL